MLGLAETKTKIKPEYLSEYRCQACNKLLAKGRLMFKDSVLEVKCRGCGRVCFFEGEDAGMARSERKAH